MLKSKTFWTGVTAIAVAVGAWRAGELGQTEMIQSVFAALSVIFMRQGVAKGPTTKTITITETDA